MSISYASSVDAETKVASGSRYSLNGISPEEGSSSVTLSAASTTRSTFELPAGTVYNLSESKLRFTLAMQDPVVEAQSVFIDSPPIQRISLQTRGGQYLCEIPNVQDFWKITKQHTPITKYVSQPAPAVSDTKAAAQDRGVITFNQPTNALSEAFNGDITIGSGRVTNAVATIESAFLAGFRKDYLTQASWATLDNGSGMYVNCELSLGDLMDTVFALRQNFCTSEVLQIVIEWAPYSNFTFSHNAVATLVGADEPVTATNIEDLRLYLALEMNDASRDAFLQKMMTSGLEYVVPYPHVVSYSLGAGANASVNVRINRGHGQRLLRICSAERLTANGNVGATNFYNRSAAKVSVFHTELNSQRLQNENIDVSKGVDWLYMSPLLKETAAVSACDWRSVAPTWVDDFSAVENLGEACKKSFMVDGLDLSNELNWSKVIDTKTAAAHTMVVAIVCQKALRSDANGVVLA